MTTYRRYSFLVDKGYVKNRTTLARWIREGTFPKPIPLGPNSIAWTDEMLEAFDQERQQAAEDAGKAA